MLGSGFAGSNLPMRASVFEFTYRDLIIRLIYLLAVLCFAFDRAMVASLLAERIAARSAVSVETATRAILFGGASLVVLAGLTRTWATAHLRYDVMRNPRIITDRLITEGPFGHLRNPLYFGNLLMVFGVSLFLSPSGMVVLVVASAVFIQRLVLREEIELTRIYGSAFHEYCQVVRRWVPSVQSHSAAGEFTPSFKNGVVGELLIWIIALALGVYAATFNLWLLAIIFVGAFIPGAARRITRSVQRRAQKRAA